MESVSARFEKFEPVHRVSGKNFFETGLQTGLSEPGHSPNPLTFELPFHQSHPGCFSLQESSIRGVMGRECDIGPPDSGPHPLPDSGPPDCSPPDCGPPRSGQCSPHQLSRGDYCRENNDSSPPSKFRSSRGGTTVRIFTTVVPPSTRQ